MKDPSSRRLLAIASLFTVLSACGPAVTVPLLAPSDVPLLQALANDPEGQYRIEPGDTLQIRYPFHPERDQKEIVRPDGTLRAAEIGDIDVAGRTTVEVEQLLVERSSTVLRDPQVVVNVAEFSPKDVYVGGEVAAPGSVTYRKGLTVVQAIANVGGLLPTARPDSVILVRPDTVSDRYVSRRIDIAATLERGDPELVTLAPHDVLYVPRSTIAEADLWMDQHFTKLVPFFSGVGTGVSTSK
jgi:protein involved in polysaccharide export with SLBB domain